MIRLPSQRLQSILLNVSLLLASLGFCTFATEALLRYGVIENSMHERRRIRGNPPLTKKILFLGDSFIAYNHYGKHCLEHIVHELDGSGIGVVDSAIPNTGPVSYLIELKNALSEQEFDQVYLFYYAGNDLTNVMRYIDWSSKEIESWSIKNVLRPFLRATYLYNYYLEVRFLKLPELFRNHNTTSTEELHSKSAENKDIQATPNTKNFLLDNILIQSDHAESAWSEVERIFEEAKDLLAARKIDFQIVVFPSPVQVGSSHNQYFAELGFSVDDVLMASSEPQSRVMEFCRQHNLRCLDLLPAIRDSGRTDLYLDYDTHLSPEGNTFAGDLIASFILSNTAGKS